MTLPVPASPRLVSAASLTLAAVLTLGACSTAPSPSGAAGSSSPTAAAATPVPTPTPAPTPAPTPRYENERDTELAALIPTEAAGAAITVAPFDEFALTPGDVAVAFGELGNRFASLVLAYIPQPRTSLYAMRVDGDPVTTDDLEPHLATAGRYVGIAGLDAESWEAAVVGRNQVWTRGEDNATAAGTHIYTWSSGEFVFLLIGVDDAVNRAIVEQLPGEPAPTPTPVPSASTLPSSLPSGSPGG
jgi:hypothetical protein